MYMQTEEKFIPYLAPQWEDETMLAKSKSFYEWMDTRRTVRDFSPKDFDLAILENCIRSASTAPSGAHKQPWVFCIIRDQDIRKKIREAAEEEEWRNYNERMSEEWLNDLKPFKTNHIKPFITDAPYLVVVFKKSYDIDEQGEKHQNYYVNESVGLACGMFITALHQAGLGTLTHTPSPMNFLKRILNRPKNEQPFLLMPIGKIKKDATVPDLTRKSLSEIMEVY